MLIFRDRRKRALIKKRPSMIVGTCMAKSHCLNALDRCGTIRAHQQKSTRKIYVGSRQTDEEIGHNKTRQHLARKMVKSVKKFFTAQSHKEMVEEEPKLDAARAQRSIYSIPGDDPDYGKIVNIARKEHGSKESLSDALQSHHSSKPERFKLGATPW